MEIIIKPVAIIIISPLLIYYTIHTRVLVLVRLDSWTSAIK
jgi:hypothetical protein